MELVVSLKKIPPVWIEYLKKVYLIWELYTRNGFSKAKSTYFFNLIGILLRCVDATTKHSNF